LLLPLKNKWSSSFQQVKTIFLILQQFISSYP